MIDVFDQTSVVLSGVNWIRWTFEERRVFAQRERVEQRLQWLLRRLEFLVSRVPIA
jgi:hypothetical protein